MDTAGRLGKLAALRNAAGFPHGFNDRYEAGRALALHLQEYARLTDAIVLALPRGGVPVGFEIAHTLDLPLDVFVVKKIGAPGYEELAIGAVASEGIYLLDEALIAHLGLSKQEIERVASLAHDEVERRESTYRDHRPAPRLEGTTVILVDDGLATGSSMQVAVAALRRRGPRRIIVAVPVASKEAATELKQVADDVVCARVPDPFYAVGAWYDDFSQTSDDEVRDLLERAFASRRTPP